MRRLSSNRRHSLLRGRRLSVTFARKESVPMEALHFDHLTQALTAGASRRGILRGLASAGLGLFVARIPGAMEAKKKRARKLKRNSYGCVDVGLACRGNSGNCCSGICEGKKPRKGKKDKSHCAGHNAGICQVEAEVCTGTEVVCGPNGVCVQTTGKGCFCAAAGGACAVCQRDPDCVALGWGPNSACLPEDKCAETGGTACVAASL